MNNFDKRLKAMAGAEVCPVPEGFEGRIGKQLEELNETKARKSRPARWALAAACLCVMLVGTAAAAVQLSKIGIIKLGKGVGYEITSQVTAYPVDELGSELQRFYLEDSSTEIATSFDSIQEAGEYVGIPLRANQLLEKGLTGQVWLEADMTLLLGADLTVDGQQFIWSATICLDRFGVGVGEGDGMIDESETGYSSEEYTMANGEVAVIITSNTGELYATEWNAAYAYFVADGIRYMVTFGDGGQSANYQAQRALLCEILDAFE